MHEVTMIMYKVNLLRGSLYFTVVWRMYSHIHDELSSSSFILKNLQYNELKQIIFCNSI